MPIINGNVTDQNEAPVGGALVYIYDSAGVLADLTDDLDQPLTQPITTGEDGYWEAYIAKGGYYTLRYYWGGRERRVEANFKAGEFAVTEANSATPTEIWAGTAEDRYVSPDSAFGAAAPVNLTDAATVAVNMAAGFNFNLVLGGNRTLGNPTNAKPGQSGRIRVTQGAGGPHVLGFASNWRIVGGDIELSTVPGAFNILSYFVNTASDIELYSDSLSAFAGESGAAAIGFTQDGGNAETVQDALRREVWADQYKLDTDTEDRDCIERAVAAVLSNAGGGVVRLSRRAYTFAGPLEFEGINNVRLIGAGNSSSGTMIRETFTSGDGVRFVGCQHCEISGVQFWPTVRKTAGYSVTIAGGSYACRADFRTDYGWNGLNIEGATETRYKVNSRYMLGTHGVNFAGTVTHPSYRAVCEDQISDNPYPAAAGATNAKTFTSGMSLSVGDHFVANGAVYQCSSAGTAAASAPSGYPSGSTPESVFTGTITSGTATLKWVCNTSLVHLVQDNWGYSLVIEKAALLNGAIGYRMTDTAATGSSYPIWCFADDLECDHNYYTGVDLDRGEGFFDFGGAWLGSCLTGNGLAIDSNFRGEVAFGPGSRIMGNAQHGILRQAGPVDVRFVGVECADNSAASSGTYHGLVLASGAVDTHIVGGRYGDSISVSGNAQSYGILINASCDKTSIIGAVVRGNTTGGISVGASQTNLIITGCPGYNDAAAATVSVGASPFTWTNTTGNAVQARITGGTVSAVTVAGDQVAAGSNVAVLVPAGVVLQINHTGAPVLKVQHV